MKKILFALTALLFATTQVQAQREVGSITVGVNLGVGISSLTHADYMPLTNAPLDKEVHAAALVNVAAEYQLTEKLALGAALGFAEQGCSWENFNDGTVRFKDPEIELSYLQLPLTAKYYVLKNLAVKSGVQFGYLYDAEANLTAKSYLEGRKLVTTQHLDIRDDCKRFDVSVPVALSYDFAKNFSVEMAYNIPLTRVNKHVGLGAKDNKNSVFMISVGYKVPLKKLKK